MKKKGSRKWMIFVGVGIAAAAAVLFLVLPNVQAKSAASTPGAYQTQAVTRGTINGTVGATGNIRTNQTVSLAWQTSGMVSKIDVTLGQQVQAGTVLGELNPASLPQTVINAQNNLAADQKAVDDLLNSNVARATAQVTLVQAQQALQTAQKTAQSKQFKRADQNTIDIAQANLIQAQSALDNAATIYNKNKSRSSTDPQYAAALSQYASAQQKVDQAQLNLAYVQGLPDPLEVQLANANLQLAQANVLDAQRAWDRVKDGPNPQDVAAAQAKVDADQAIIDEARIVAPISGTITAVNNQPGDVVSTGANSTAAFEIDDLTHMYVDIQVSEVDIDKVQTGQAVSLTFDAISSKTYQGKVTNISSVGALSSGAVNYSVTVELLNHDPEIKIGMTSSASIDVPGTANALLIPNRAVRTVSSRQVVYLLRNGAAVAVPVTLGSSSGAESELASGNVRDGDLIILNPPSSTTTPASGIGGIFGRLFGGGGARIAVGGGGGGGNFQGGTGGTGTNRTGTGGTTGGSTGGNTGGNRPVGGD